MRGITYPNVIADLPVAIILESHVAIVCLNNHHINIIFSPTSYIQNHSGCSMLFCSRRRRCACRLLGALWRRCRMGWWCAAEWLPSLPCQGLVRCRWNA